MYPMSKIVEKDRLTRLVSIRVTERAFERARALKGTTTIDVNETLRLWFDEMLAQLELEAEKYQRERTA
jgi:hypothetical protein